MELSCPKILLLRRWRLRRSIEITPPSENFILLLIESAKSFTYLLLCFRCLVSYIFSCSTCLRNFLPNKISSLPYLVPYVYLALWILCLTSSFASCAWNASRALCLMCSRFWCCPACLAYSHVSFALPVIGCLMCNTLWSTSRLEVLISCYFFGGFLFFLFKFFFSINYS